jgi:hypothetical protein
MTMTILQVPNIWRGLALAIVLAGLAGCATSKVTMPARMALEGRGDYTDKILAVMPLGALPEGYTSNRIEELHAWWMPRKMYGSGEVTTLADPNQDMALAIFNRYRGHGIFRRVVVVKDRAEADRLHADYLLCFRINDCYAVGRGANANFVEWLTYEGFVNMDVAVYDLPRNRRIASQRVRADATATSVWSGSEMRDYLRRQLLRGATFNNAIAQIDF